MDGLSREIQDYQTDRNLRSVREGLGERAEGIKDALDPAGILNPGEVF